MADVELDYSWGLDHGTWPVLTHMFPAADIPVVQLGIDRNQPASFHYDLSQRLSPLRDDGVLILGSGTWSVICTPIHGATIPARTPGRSHSRRR